MKAYKDYEDWNKNGGWNEELECSNSARNWREVWKQARQGMIPEDEAVRIPPVSEWPVWARRITVWYDGFRDQSEEEDGAAKIIKEIKRPAPAWTPKVCDVVFCLSDGHGKEIYVGVITAGGRYNECDFLVKTNDGDEGDWTLSNLKPFDASKIGLPWEQI